MGNNVIAAVENMTLSEVQHILGRYGPLFEWRPGVPLNNGDSNMDQDPPLNYNVDGYELELPREAEIGVHAEDYEYNDASIVSKEETIDDVDDADPIEKYK